MHLDPKTDWLMSSVILWSFHRKRTVHMNENFDFLKDIVSKVPDPVEGDASNNNTVGGEARGTKRRKTAAVAAAQIKNADDSE